MEIYENEKAKVLVSDNYNFILDKRNGKFQRWGETPEDDALSSPYGNEILDLEISQSVNEKDLDKFPRSKLVKDGGCKGNCPFCYKSNGKNLPTYNMTFETFFEIFDRMPRTMYSIAFGIMNIDTNPDFFEMARHAKKFGVMPTFTMHGLDEITSERVETISELMGAVAVSVYNKEKSYDWIKALTDAGMNQVNIHYFLSQETYNGAIELIEDLKVDPRLEKLNAVVFLHNKGKGNSKINNFHCLSDESYTNLISLCIHDKVRFGMDSCGANRFLKFAKNYDKDFYESVEGMVDPCESGLFSAYINVLGEYFPCSFMEGERDWKEGIKVLDYDSFLQVWESPRVEAWRSELHKCGRNCPRFKV
jgi:MoaA/NifB/PqqE/SkfB family radical SAM enzyme